MKQILFIGLSVALMAAGCKTNHPAGTVFHEPVDPDTLASVVWEKVPGRIHAAFGNINIRYRKSRPPEKGLSLSWEGMGWRGEKIHTQVILWSTEDTDSLKVLISKLQDGHGNTIRASSLSLHPVGYVLSDTVFTRCLHRSQDTMPARLSPDILYNNRPFILRARSVRPVWLTVDIPRDVSPGLYRGSVIIRSQEDSVYLPYTIKVQSLELPPPSDWYFHLDLWQNPYAIARYHEVPLWSEEHWQLIRKYLKLLAGAGQKCITTSITYKPWGGQTYDPFGSMITWLHSSNGRWDYDYSVFDQYVQTAMEEGITAQINCYTMVPWGNRFRYFEEDSSGYVTVQCRPGSKTYEALWQPFLADFREHLREMGWLDKTVIALDERGHEDTRNLIRFLQQTAPEFKLALAGRYFDDITPNIYDFSYNYHFLSKDVPAIAGQRRIRKQITTYYVACGIPKPNNFTFSPPAESAYEGWLAAALNLDGFLRWAYNSWPKDPMHDSRFVTWSSGDTYLVYPGPYSSVRFERLREGIQDYEKIRILKTLVEEKNGQIILPDSLNPDVFLQTIDPESIQHISADRIIRQGKKLVNNLTDFLTKQH
ncbi:MAG: DUF4091 domain-containing protein [Bacteroidales bacterium]|nr:DUF4091 domain-containing protein [Bacteroidales bacterium]